MHCKAPALLLLLTRAQLRQIKHLNGLTAASQYVMQRSCILPMQAKVAVLGAAGGIGQPLSLLLKNSPLIGELSLYDVANTAGVACDLSHISTAAKVKGYTGPAQLQEALHGCQLVIIPAGGVLCCSW